MSRCRAAFASIVIVLASCTPHPVGPARTLAAYEGKAVTTAESARSAVASVQLASETATAGNGFGPYLSVLIADQEEALSGVQGTFASIQPPDERADAVRAELDDALTDALGHVTDVRVAVRRGELDGLARVAEPLADDVVALDAFIAEHGR